MSQEPREIYPVLMDGDAFTDFRALPVSSAAPEEEVPNPKAESAPEPADSPESPTPIEQTSKEIPAPPPAGLGASSPSQKETGSPTS